MKSAQLTGEGGGAAADGAGDRKARALLERKNVN